MRVRSSPMINADFQCSAASTTARLGRDVIVVSHCCKDGNRAMYWMAVCVPGPRWAWIDARMIGAAEDWEGAAAPSMTQRRLFIELLRARFTDVEQLWSYAIAENLPRDPLEKR